MSSDIFSVPPVRLFQLEVDTLNADELLLYAISLVRFAPVIVTDDDGAVAFCLAVKFNEVVLAVSDGVPGEGVEPLLIVPVQLI